MDSDTPIHIDRLTIQNSENKYLLCMHTLSIWCTLCTYWPRLGWMWEKNCSTSNSIKARSPLSHCTKVDFYIHQELINRKHFDLKFENMLFLFCVLYFYYTVIEIKCDVWRMIQHGSLYYLNCHVGFQLWEQLNHKLRTVQFKLHNYESLFSC